MTEKNEIRTKRAEAGREGARRRWGSGREATRMVRVFAGDADTLGLIAATSADAVRWLLSEAQVTVHRAALTLDLRDAKSLSGLREPGNPLFLEGVRVAYPAGEQVVAISFPVKKLGEMLSITRLHYGESKPFHTELNRAFRSAKGTTAVVVFPFEKP